MLNMSQFQYSVCISRGNSGAVASYLILCYSYCTCADKEKDRCTVISESLVKVYSVRLFKTKCPHFIFFQYYHVKPMQKKLNTLCDIIRERFSAHFEMC